ncbi:hypothetical protein ACWERI_07200 [Streptomyces collinus]
MRTGEPLPSVSDVLAALATGLWHWDTAAGLVTVDAEAARLLGLPARATTLTEAQTRARLQRSRTPVTTSRTSAGRASWPRRAAAWC